MTVNGNLINNGTISNNDKSVLYLNVSGNILNNGTWNNSRTTLTFPSGEFRMTGTPTWEKPYRGSSYNITDYLTTQHHWQVSVDGGPWSEYRGINDPSLVALPVSFDDVIIPPVGYSGSTVSGFVRTPDGEGVANIRICANGDGICDIETYTDEKGYFSISDSLPNGDYLLNNEYLIYPFHHDESRLFIFTPIEQKFTLPITTENMNFTAKPVTDDHGDAPFSSTPIILNSNTSGQINTRFDRDCFKVDVPSYGVLTVNITSDISINGGLAKMGLEGGEWLIRDEGQNFKLSKELEADSYYICLKGMSTSKQPNYSLNPVFIPLQISSCDPNTGVGCTASYSVSNETANIPCIVIPGFGTFEVNLTMIPNSTPPRLALDSIKQVSKECAGRPSLYLPDIGKLNIPEFKIPELGHVFDVTFGLDEQAEFTVENVKPPLKEALRSLNGWSFKADVLGETYTYILKKFDNPFDADGFYWKATNIAKIGSPKLITVVLQENGDLAINHTINGHDYTFTLQAYNNPTDQNGVYWQYVDCSKVPSYWNFFLIENPSCRQKQSLFFFLNIVAPEIRRLQANIQAIMKGIVSAEDRITIFNDAVDTFAGYFSLFSCNTSDTTIETTVKVTAGLTDFTAGITQTLYGDSEITSIVVDGLGQLLSGAASGTTNPALIIDLSADFSTSVFRFALAFSLNEAIERLNETVILNEYYLQYLGYGGNSRLLRTHLGLPVDASLKKVVRKVADNHGYSEGWFSENYKADRVINLINGFDEAFKQINF
ncbi:MAG TPA: carboxypeptidase regulatory-like domain-containing protein [Thiotrichaceae bacterium]|nr:carboxypeptidase regulatory-like domain-containing protein [Thiotrichaceae bacterium]